MRSILLVLTLFGATLSATAKEPDPHFKTAEAKHFTRAEGVELSPEFTDYLYAELRNELMKTKLYDQVIGEGEAVEDADAPKSIVITGTITEYKKGNRATDAIIGWGVGARSLKVDATVLRRNDNQTLSTIHVHVKVSPRWNEKVMARFAAQDIAKEVKKSLKAENKTS